MVTFKAEISLENAAFIEAGRADEITRILGVVSRQLQAGAVNGQIRDLNGNQVGIWTINAESEQQ